MRSLERNKRRIWFSNPTFIGEDDTGNSSYDYPDAKSALVNISAPTGYAYGQENGIWLDYAYVIVVTEKEFESLGFIEGKTLIWFDNPTDQSADLIVNRVARSLNQVKIGLTHR